MNGQNFQIRYHATRGLRFAWFGLLITVLPMMLSGNNEGEVILLHEKELMAIVERENHFFERLQASGVTPLAETEAQQIIASYRSYLLRNPDSLDGLILYGKFFRKIGDNQEAIRVFLAARKREPKLAVVHQELGNCLAEEGEYKGALTCFLNAVELDPNQAVYHYQLAVLLTVFKEEFAEMEEFTGPMLEEQADAAFAKAHELAPYNPDVLLAWGDALEGRAEPNWEESLKIWDKLMELANSDTQQQIVGMRRARVLVELARYEQAREQLQKITFASLQQNRNELEARLPKENLQP